MSTKGLKAGDIVLYKTGQYNFLATVVEVTATTKASIQPLTDVDAMFNTRTLVNTYRKHMQIVAPMIV